MADDDWAGPATPIKADSDWAGPATKIGEAPAAAPAQQSWLERLGVIGPPRQHPSSLWGRITETDPLSKATVAGAWDEATGVTDTAKNMALGAAGQVSGVGEMIPGAHPYAANLSSAIKGQITNPAAADVGALAPWVAGGEFLGAGKAAKLGGEAAEYLLPKAAQGAKGFMPWLQTAGSNVVKGAAQGAGGAGVVGAEAGAAKPTGKENYGEAISEKWDAVKEGGGGGALMGASLGAGGELAGEAAGVVDWATGGKVSKLLESTLSKARGVSKTAVESKTKEAADLERQAADKKPMLDRAEAELAALDEKQAAIEAGKTPARDEASPIHPEERTLRIREKISRERRQRVAEAQKKLEATGMSAHYARAHAVAAEYEASEVEAAAKAISDEMAKNGGFLTGDELGEKIGPSALNLYRSLRAYREKLAGFQQAIDSAGPEPIVDTSDMVSSIGKLFKDINNPELESRLHELKRRLQTPTTDAEGNPTVVAKLSLKRADSLRGYLNDILDMAESKIQSTDSAVSKTVQKYVADSRDALQKRMVDAHEPFKKAMADYTELSEPIRPFKEGDLSDVVQTGKDSKLKLLAGKITDRVMQRSGKGSNAFDTLLQDRPHLATAGDPVKPYTPSFGTQDLKDFFRRKLYGNADTARGVSAEKMRSFLNNNEVGMKQAGVYEDFAADLKKLEAEEGKIATAKGKAGEAGENADFAELQADVARQKAAAEKSTAGKAEQREKQARADAVKRLKVLGDAKRGDVKALQGEIDTAVKEGSVAAETAHDIRQLVNLVDRENLTPSEVATRMEKLYVGMEKRKVITEDELKAFQDEIDKLRGAVKTQETLKKWTKRTVMAIIIGLLGYDKARNLHITTGAI